MAGKNNADLFSLAALEPQHWPQVLATIASDTQSDFAQLIGFGPSLEIDFNWLAGCRPGEELSRAVMSLPSEINFRVAAHTAFPNEAILHELHYAQVKRAIASPLYVETCRTHGIEHGCQTDLYEGSEGFIGLALLRSEKNGPTSAAQRRLFDRWRRRAGAAVSLQIALEREGFRIIAGTFEAMNSAVFVLDRQMRARAFSPKAEVYLRAGSLKLEAGLLTAGVPQQAESLDKLSASIASGALSAGRVALRRSPDSPIVCQIHRLPEREWSFGFAPFAVAVITEPELPAEDTVETIRSAFGLTQGEASIAYLLVKGVGREAIRIERQIGKETLRSHLRAIFGKLGVRRETDAVRIILQLLN